MKSSEFPEKNSIFRKSGSILVLTALGMVLFVGLIAVVTDIGWMYAQKNRLETAVNAGWKAGYDEIKRLTANSNQPLDADGQALVRSKVLEVIRRNGVSDAALQDVNVSFGANDYLSVTSSQTVGLFFARALGVDSANVAARRASGEDEGRLIPLAIPYGVVKDLSRTTYSVDFFPVVAGGGAGDPSADGFASGSEYILKLGSGGGNGNDPPPTPPEEVQMILVPMDAGSQSDLGFERAYGIAFWCLKIDASDPGFVPCYWLLGYRGGAFMLTYHADVISQLNRYNVNYQIITGQEAVQAIFDAVNPNVLELYNRPRIAVYSSQSNPDPVETVLREAYIPYGTYGLPPAVHPNGWTRAANYNANNATRIYDGEIEAGALNSYHWVHLHHEDFTGNNGGCYYYDYSCKDFLTSGWLGATNTSARRTAAAALMCTYCRTKYTTSNGNWSSSYAPLTPGNCANVYRRCAEKRTYSGAWWRDNSTIRICNQSDADRPQCLEYNTLLGLSSAFTADANSEPKPQTVVSTNGSTPLADNQDGWFNRANQVQKMKWDVARKIRSHVQTGGFLFAQCFAPETLDLALWQAGIHDGLTPAAAYEECLAFTDMHYKTMPWRSGATWFSSINSRSTTSTQNFTVNHPLDPRCQLHTTTCDTGQGHTASFVGTTIKSSVTRLGDDNAHPEWAKYISGTNASGTFTFLGGHFHNNIATKRLVLNNVLLGSLVTKVVDGGPGGDTTVTGRQKNNYGPIDPDNVTGGGANDYRDRFMFGFNQPIQIGDRITPDSGNMVGPTNQAVDYHVNGVDIASPGRLVIVPITDVPPEVPGNNTHNASATAIYDLQGQDHPNGVYSPDAYDFGSSVRIIGFAIFRILDPSEYSRDGANVLDGDAGDLGYYQSGQVRGVFVRYLVKPGEMTPY